MPLQAREGCLGDLGAVNTGLPLDRWCGAGPGLVVGANSTTWRHQWCRALTLQRAWYWQGHQISSSCRHFRDQWYCVRWSGGGGRPQRTLLPRHCGHLTVQCRGEKQPDAGRALSHSPLSVGAEDQLFSMSLQCFFFGTREDDRCQEALEDGGMLCTEAEVLDAESECGSEAGLRASSLSRTFKRAARSFWVRGLKSLQIWQQSFL